MQPCVPDMRLLAWFAASVPVPRASKAVPSSFSASTAMKPPKRVSHEGQLVVVRSEGNAVRPRDRLGNIEFIDGFAAIWIQNRSPHL